MSSVKFCLDKQENKEFFNESIEILNDYQDILFLCSENIHLLRIILQGGMLEGISTEELENTVKLIVGFLINTNKLADIGPRLSYEYYKILTELMTACKEKNI